MKWVRRDEHAFIHRRFNATNGLTKVNNKWPMLHAIPLKSFQRNQRRRMAKLDAGHVKNNISIVRCLFLTR